MSATLTPNRTAFREAVAEVAAKAKAILPVETNGRVESAVKLVLGHDVTSQDDGSIIVGSSTDPLKTYRLVGTTCECQDFTRGQAPQGWCQHRIAAALLKRAQELVPAPAPEPAPALAPAPDPAPPTGKRAIPAHFLQQIQGQTFIKYAGLLHLAHERGLQELRATWTYNDEALSLAHAVATFPFGTFQECGDSTPDSGKRVGLHWRRMSLTRAKARALRDALGIDACSVEEME